MHARDRRRRRLYPLLGSCGIFFLFVVLAAGGSERTAKLVPRAAASSTPIDPLAYAPARRVEFERRAAAGMAHVLFIPGPNALLASAQRVAHFRPLVDQSARQAAISPDTLEAILLVECIERLGAGSLQSLSTSALQARIERYDPRASIANAVRTVVAARSQLGREDLAVASVQMGADRLRRALDAYGQGNVPYAQLFFDSSPVRHPDAWTTLAPLGDDTHTYLWRVYAARDLMAQWRHNTAAVAQTADLQDNKASGEEVLHPAATTQRFADPAAVAGARTSGALRALPVGLLRTRGVIIDKQMGQLAPSLGQAPELYRALRPGALAALAYIGAGVKAMSHGGPLTITSTVRDARYQHLLIGTTVEATQNYSLHTTGWAFDVLRRYESSEQSLAFEFMLERLTALDLVAWVREPAAIHVTVGPRAAQLVPWFDSPAASAPAVAVAR
jgi:hypothetical protein